MASTTMINASVTDVIASSRVQLMRRDSHHSMAQYITTGTTISKGVRDIASAARLRRR